MAEVILDLQPQRRDQGLGRGTSRDQVQDRSADHAQQARALAEYTVDAKQNYGFPPAQLKLLLAGLLDLEPWLIQWHSALDPVIGDSPANAIRGFLDAECHALGSTRADLESVRMGS